MESTPDSGTDADNDEMPRLGEIPEEDMPSTSEQPETQGEDPVTAELGEQGEGDLSPEDV
ncbi:hypothetical protein [Microbacterium sp.]|uniref:hypothetical protein n=1 Tax=Microbacterium sp. TaxID=51671 RepID=UPI003A9398F3